MDSSLTPTLRRLASQSPELTSLLLLDANGLRIASHGPPPRSSAAHIISLSAAASRLAAGGYEAVCVEFGRGNVVIKPSEAGTIAVWNVAED